MTPKDFHDLLQRAVSKDIDALEQILELYTPLFDRYSRVDGHIDEDLRQHLLIHIAVHISDFKIN
ncbi:helix-turn-helix domain-containing protein [Acutalibacter sp. 1XD8-36]|uniref:helix-turn-helix domain-containing protein n=1 Tax=Acutalibacter sp. 1XD8-36 TaxID=2320852 RepID=UPI001412F0AA|nr:helix-turn-helix domain-containing protein [Acutalibacter sp. 1XD8-36]NBJ90188.1 helix-turn-helix domain-containing protein [Acutalibacter sp. 1XD8-36]